MAARLVQMAGWMGTGKSTLAAALVRELRCVVLDHDTTKSALLAAGVPHPPAGAASYDVVFRVAEDLLRQGHTVVIDSPSLYSSIPERGGDLARRVGVSYYFVECECPTGISDERIESRRGAQSQVTTAAAAAAVRTDPNRRPHRPAHGVLILDTSRHLDECVRDVVAYLDGPGVPIA